MLENFFDFAWLTPEVVGGGLLSWGMYLLLRTTWKTVVWLVTPTPPPPPKPLGASVKWIVDTIEKADGWVIVYGDLVNPSRGIHICVSDSFSQVAVEAQQLDECFAPHEKDAIYSAASKKLKELQLAPAKAIFEKLAKQEVM